MKKTALFSLILALMLLVLPASAESWSVYTENGRPLNVRARPNKSGKIIGKLSVGDSVDSMELVGNGSWAEITFDGRTGYCMTQFLRNGIAYTNEDLGITLFYDDGVFQLDSTAQTDTLYWHENDGTKPDCSLSITRKRGTDVNRALQEIIRQERLEITSRDYYSVSIGGAKGKGFMISGGAREGDAVREIMAVQAANKRVFVIERNSFVGAEFDADAAMEEVLQNIAYTPVRSTRPARRQESPRRDELQFVEDSRGGKLKCGICGRWYYEGYEFDTHACFDEPGVATEGNPLGP